MYKKWCENVSTLEEAIEQIQRDLRLTISKQEDNKTYNYTKILSYLVICWCEARLMKLVHEPAIIKNTNKGVLNKPKSFSDTEIGQIVAASTLRDQWITALQIGFSKAYHVSIDVNFPDSLLFTPRTKYLEINNLINNELLKSIELRNRIAHGQWKQAFTNDLSNFSQPLTTALRRENIVSLQLNFGMFKAIAQFIHDLASSPRTFERDFDFYYKIIEENKHNLHNRDYNIYRNNLIEKYQRGLNSRERNAQN